MTVHFLSAGAALCGAGAPLDWPADDRFVSHENGSVDDVTCPTCRAWLQQASQRCKGRYPVPMPRDEPFPVTYRCGKTNGHAGDHGPDERENVFV